MRWLRLYDDTINDPKIIKLPEATRWHWIAMLCIASKNDGALPALDDVAIQLRVTAAKATEIISALVKAQLLDKTETGFAPHNWNGRQYKSDVSTDRVKRFRNGQRNVSPPVTSTVSETPPETEADTEKKIAAPKDAEPKPDKKSRSKPKVTIPDGFSFGSAVRQYAVSLGFSDSEIAREMQRFIRHAKQNDRRCADWQSAAENWFDKAAEFSGKVAPRTGPDADDGMIEVLNEDQLTAWDRYAASKGAKSFPRNRRGGWRFPSPWPPGHMPDVAADPPPAPLLRAM